MARKKPSKLGRSVWTGSLSIGLVSLPVKAYTSAKSSREYALKNLCGECYAPISQRLHCDVCDVDRDREELVSGYEAASDQFVLVDKGKLPVVEKSEAIEVSRFVPFDRVDLSICAGKTHWLVPETGAAIPAYRVLYDSLSEMGVVGITKVSISKSTSVVLVRPFEGLLTLVHLEFAGQAKEVAPFQEAAGEGTEAAQKDVSLMKRLIKQKCSMKLSLHGFRDLHKDALKKQIESRLRRKKIVTAKQAPIRGKAALSVTEALKASLKKAGAS